MFTRPFLLFAVLLLVAALAPAQDTKKELDKLQGDWTLVAVETKGKEVPVKVGTNVRKLTIKGDQWSFTTAEGGKGSAAKFKIDPSKEPKTLDLIFKSVDKELVRAGIYKLDGDTLTVCSNNPNAERPTEFKTTEGTGFVRIEVFKRAKK